MKHIESLLNMCETLQIGANLHEEEKLKRSLKKIDREASKNGLSEELVVQNVEKSDDLIDRVDDLIKQVKKLPEIAVEMHINSPRRHILGFGNDFSCYMSEILDLLTQPKASTISVWGMREIGKFFLIENLLEFVVHHRNIDGTVYWISVSKYHNMQLQSDIANHLRHCLNVPDERKRATKLHQIMKSTNRVVLMLDDIWSDFSWTEAGFTIPKEIGDELIATSQSKEVCVKMYCYYIIKVGLLSEEDALTEFFGNIRNELVDDLKDIMIYRSIDILTNIEREISGLPTGVAALVNRTIGSHDVSEWRNVLIDLRNSKGKVENNEENVFRILKFSREPSKNRSESLSAFLSNVEGFPISKADIQLLMKLKMFGVNIDTAKMIKEIVPTMTELEQDSLLSLAHETIIKSNDVFEQDLVRDTMLQIAFSHKAHVQLSQENSGSKELKIHSSEKIDDLTLGMCDKIKFKFPTADLVGKNFKSYIEKILDLLYKNEASTIGVWGMGGVGKTSLIKHLYNRMLDQPRIYGSVYWITVSKDCSIKKLQTDVAEKVGEPFAHELDDLQRAGILTDMLKRRKKFVLILDDLWSAFDLKEVGLGSPKELGYRLILTSRSKDVCSKMNGHNNIIKVEPLSEKDAWTLFLRTIDRDIPANLSELSKQVVRECKGLPLGVITLAKSMIARSDECEWRNVLDELRNSSCKEDDMETEVFNVLKWSYDSLKNAELKNCLLYCAAYPEDHQIEINELIWWFIDVGLLGENASVAKMFDKGLTILKKLERAALLSIEKEALQEDREYVLLHDLIRDMAVRIAGSRFMIKAGKGLKDIPNKRSWTDELEVVSLMANEIEQVSVSSQKCSNLSTLLLQKNSMRTVSDGFLSYLTGLKHLNLSGSLIQSLPESISLLTNLTALILRGCLFLENVPSLAKLTSLERLDLYETPINQLPGGIESVITLRYLNLFYTKIRRIGAGVISKLTALQYLAVGAKIDVKELGSLRSLEHLTVLLEDFASFSALINQMKVKGRPDSYTIALGNFKDAHLINMNASIWNEKRIYLRKTESPTRGNAPPCVDQYDRVFRLLFGEDNLEYFSLPEGRPKRFCENGLQEILQDINLLDIWGDEDARSLGDFVFEMGGGHKPFSNLKRLKLYHCRNLKRLLPLELWSNFQNIEEIEICSCKGLEEFIEDVPDETTSAGAGNSEELRLPKLRLVQCKYLPNLKSLFSENKLIHTPSLQWIEIMRCPKLKQMELEVDEECRPCPQMVYLEDEQEWFDSLKWAPKSARKMVVRGI